MWKWRLREAMPEMQARWAMWREQVSRQLSELLENLRWSNATPKELGLFAAEVPPEHLSETESRVEKLIAYDESSLPVEEFSGEAAADEASGTNDGDL